VIHAWWVPVSAPSRDAIPASSATCVPARDHGTFRSQCVELCGKDTVHADRGQGVTQEEYSKWVGEKLKEIAPPPTTRTGLDLPGLVRVAEKVYASICVTCHAGRGQGTPSLKAPALRATSMLTGAEEGPIDTVLNAGRHRDGGFRKQLSTRRSLR